MELDKKSRELITLIASASSRVARISFNDEFRRQMFDQTQATSSADVQEYLQETLLARIERNKRPRLSVASQNIRLGDNSSNRRRKIADTSQNFEKENSDPRGSYSARDFTQFSSTSEDSTQFFSTSDDNTQ